MTPQGVISFVSKGCSGKVSDKYVTEQCELLDYLLPGVQILADRGFNVEESVGLHCAEIKVPAYTRGKNQLSSVEIECTRKLFRVRIHVEKVIGVLKQKYTIFSQSFVLVSLCESANNVSFIDKAVVVCCALCNCCEPIVPS